MSIQINLQEPHDKQKEILSAFEQYRFLVLKCGRRFGKSFICQQLSLIHLLQTKNVAYITPEFGLAKEFFNEILNLIPKQLISKSNQSDLIIELVNGGKIQFFSGNALKNLRGRKYHLIIVDEAAFIPDLETEWKAAIRPTLTDYQGKAIFISTPLGKNYFISLFQNERTDKNWKSFHFTSYDNPHLPKDEIDQAKKDLSEVEFEQEYLASETGAVGNPFRNNIEKNIKPTSNKATICYGIDIAKSFDYAAIYGISEDGECTYLDVFQSHSYTTIQAKIKALPYDIPKILDVTGVGIAVYDNIVFDSKGNVVVENIHKFVFTQKSKIKIFNELIKDVEEGNVSYPRQVADEMSTIQMTYSSNGFPKFEAQSGFHDDIVCAFAIANSKRKKLLYYQDWSVETL